MDSWTTKAMLGHWDCTHLTLTQITSSLFLVGIEMAFHELHHYLLFLYSCHTPASVQPPQLWLRYLLNSLAYSLVRNKCHNDLAHKINSSYVSCNFIGSIKFPVEFTQNGPKSLQLPPHTCILKVIISWPGVQQRSSTLDQYLLFAHA